MVTVPGRGTFDCHRTLPVTYVTESGNMSSPRPEIFGTYRDISENSADHRVCGSQGYSTNIDNQDPLLFEDAYTRVRVQHEIKDICNQ